MPSNSSRLLLPLAFISLHVANVLSLTQKLHFCGPLGNNLTQVCENHIPTHVCMEIFGRAKAGRPKRCGSPYLQAEALQCAKHCRLCCEREEHSCKDGRAAEGKSCKRHRIDQSCWARGNIGQMSGECAGTCGLCGREKRDWEEELMCRDSQWDCPDMRDFCPFDGRVRGICPKTCQEQLKALGGLIYRDPCEERRQFYEFRWAKPPEDEDCFDTRGDCRNEIFFCDKPNYYSKLREECPRTCAQCKPPGHKCVDKDSQKCALWQGHKHRPFCQSHSFSKGAKFHWCPKTCELC